MEYRTRKNIVRGPVGFNAVAVIDIPFPNYQRTYSSGGTNKGRLSKDEKNYISLLVRSWIWPQWRKKIFVEPPRAII